MAAPTVQPGLSVRLRRVKILSTLPLASGGGLIFCATAAGARVKTNAKIVRNGLAAPRVMRFLPVQHTPATLRRSKLRSQPLRDEAAQKCNFRANCKMRGSPTEPDAVPVIRPKVEELRLVAGF